MDSSQDHDNNFLDICEEDYEEDPPPSYHDIGPAPIPFRECVRQRHAATGQGDRRRRSHFVSQCAVRETQRRRSFGIGGAGNIRPTKISGVVIHPASALLIPTSSNGVHPSVHFSPAVPMAPTLSTTVQPTFESILQGEIAENRRESTSGANDLRDKLVDGVKTIISNVGHAIHISHHDEQ